MLVNKNCDIDRPHGNCYWLVPGSILGVQALTEPARLWEQVEKRDINPEIPQTFEQREYVRLWSEKEDVEDESSCR